MTENKAIRPTASQQAVPPESGLTAGGEFRKSLDSFEIPPIVPVQMTVAQLNSEAPSKIDD